MKKLAAQQNDLPDILLERVLKIVRADDRDLSLRQLAVLLTCQSTNQPPTVRGLAEHFGIPKPAITRAVDRLEKVGLAERRDDPDDGRSVLVASTAAGQRFCKKFVGAKSRNANR
jgi:DNA-binding MarR family transcriptional regulator